MCARQYLFIFARTRPFKQQSIEVVINQTSAQHSTTLPDCQSVCNKFVRYEKKIPTIFLACYGISYGNLFASFKKRKFDYKS